MSSLAMRFDAMTSPKIVNGQIQPPDWNAALNDPEMIAFANSDYMKPFRTQGIQGGDFKISGVQPTQDGKFAVVGQRVDEDGNPVSQPGVPITMGRTSDNNDPVFTLDPDSANRFIIGGIARFNPKIAKELHGRQMSRALGVAAMQFNHAANPQEKQQILDSVAPWFSANKVYNAANGGLRMVERPENGTVEIHGPGGDVSVIPSTSAADTGRKISAFHDENKAKSVETVGAAQAKANEDADAMYFQPRVQRGLSERRLTQQQDFQVEGEQLPTKLTRDEMVARKHAEITDKLDDQYLQAQLRRKKAEMGAVADKELEIKQAQHDAYAALEGMTTEERARVEERIAQKYFPRRLTRELKEINAKEANQNRLLDKYLPDNIRRKIEEGQAMSWSELYTALQMEDGGAAGLRAKRITNDAMAREKVTEMLFNKEVQREIARRTQLDDAALQAEIARYPAQHQLDRQKYISEAVVKNHVANMFIEDELTREARAAQSRAQTNLETARKEGLAAGTKAIAANDAQTQDALSSLGQVFKDEPVQRIPDLATTIYGNATPAGREALRGQITSMLTDPRYHAVAAATLQRFDIVEKGPPSPKRGNPANLDVGSLTRAIKDSDMDDVAKNQAIETAKINFSSARDALGIEDGTQEADHLNRAARIATEFGRPQEVLPVYNYSVMKNDPRYMGGLKGSETDFLDDIHAPLVVRLKDKGLVDMPLKNVMTTERLAVGLIAQNVDTDDALNAAVNYAKYPELREKVRKAGGTTEDAVLQIIARTIKDKPGLLLGLQLNTPRQARIESPTLGEKPQASGLNNWKRSTLYWGR